MNAARNIQIKPARITFEQAAGVPIAAVTALQALRDKGELQEGQKVLINGASGGVGAFAVQIAKAFGAEVTGVASTRNVELVRSLGADHVVDYTKQDFTQADTQYDLVVDNVGNRSSSTRSGACSSPRAATSSSAATARAGGSARSARRSRRR